MNNVMVLRLMSCPRLNDRSYLELETSLYTRSKSRNIFVVTTPQREFYMINITSLRYVQAYLLNVGCQSVVYTGVT